MFQSSNYFKGVPCPFYQHDLCHRPFCHFKHAKVPKEKEKKKEDGIVKESAVDIITSSVEESTSTKNARKRKSRRTPSPIEAVEDDVMKIVKNITPSKLIEYAKRKQEVQELQQTLEQVDMEPNTHVDSIIASKNYTLCSKDTLVSAVCVDEENPRGLIDPQRGLIDSFYSKDKVKVNITSGNLNSSRQETITTLNDVGEVSTSRVCNCDDPDCSGFIEENDAHQFKHTIVDLSKITDEYMRRKMQRRLQRKQQVLAQSETFSFVIPRSDNKGIPVMENNDQDNFETDVPACNISNTDPGSFIVEEDKNGQKEEIDEDLSNYIEKCKAEYARKKKERLDMEKKALLEEKEQKKTLINEDAQKKTVENKISTDVDTQIKASDEKKNTTIENIEGKMPIEKEKNKCNEKKEETASNENIFETTKNSSVNKYSIEKKRTLTDVDFFSTKIKRNTTNQNNDDDSESDNETNEKKNEKKIVKKQDILSEAGMDNAEANASKKKKKKKKRTNSSEEEVCHNGNNDDDVHLDVKKSKKVKTSTVEETHSHKNSTSTNETVAKKKKSDKHDKCEKHNESNNKHEKRNTCEKKVSNSCDTVSLQNDISKKKKAGIEKNEPCDEKKIKKKQMDIVTESTNSSCSASGVIKTKYRTDSESSNTSRSAFDVIAISSSEDDGGNLDDNDGDAMSSDDCEDDGYEYVTKYDRCISNEDIAENQRLPGEVKKRVALSNEQINRKPISGQKGSLQRISGAAMLNKSVNKAKGRLDGTHSAMEPSSSYIPVSPTTDKENTQSTGKKRIAHVPQHPVKKDEKDDRPKLDVEVGGKIPHLLRQRYFDKMIDELLPKVAVKQEAFDKAMAEEADAHKRSNRKPIYLNLCANSIKRIRSMPDYVAPKQAPKAKADPMETAQPTTKSVKTNYIVKTNSLDTGTRPVKVDTAKTNLPPRIKSATIAGYQKIEKKDTIPKNCIKPASSQIVNTTLNTDKQCAKRERKISSSLEALELTEDNFYEHMQQYCLTEEQLCENKYPRRDPDNPKRAQIKDYVPSSNCLKRVCCRCGKEYFMNKKGKYVTRNECHYHWGKLLRQRGRNSNAMIYSCCGADASGSTCAMCRLHVSNKVGALENYASTELCDNKDSKRKVFSLDCEMCYTTQGLELTRLTVIDFDMEQIIDIFVKPTNPIVDYNTRFSGVTKEHLQDITTNISDIHDILLNMFDKDTILMGHSLESDLNALSLIHNKVVDTAIVFPHRMGLPLKRALRNLMVEYLHKVIQSGEGGHDSCEDARSCMELMKYKFKEDQKSRKRLKPNPLLPYSLPTQS